MGSIFDILGPVMVGPSSSHTAGAVRIGKYARSILGATPVKAHIRFSGSFAKTYKGHGTDKAVIAGILGMDTDDARIRVSMDVAKEEGLAFEFEEADIDGAHPNTAEITLEDAEGRVAAEGALPYPPGVLCCFPGEVWGGPVLKYFLAWQEAMGRMPGFAPELQGVYVEDNGRGGKQVYCYVLKEDAVERLTAKGK